MITWRWRLPAGWALTSVGMPRTNIKSLITSASRSPGPAGASLPAAGGAGRVEAYPLPRSSLHPIPKCGCMGEGDVWCFFRLDPSCPLVNFVVRKIAYELYKPDHRLPDVRRPRYPLANDAGFTRGARGGMASRAAPHARNWLGGAIAGAAGRLKAPGAVASTRPSGLPPPIRCWP